MPNISSGKWSNLLFGICITALAAGCGLKAASNDSPVKTFESNKVIPIDTSVNVFHVFVALCDNKYQGIVPVPAMIGNGQDPNSNLYWGCQYGIRSWFKKSKEWKLSAQYKKDKVRLERIVFKHATKNTYLVADAYDGQFIKQCTKDFLMSCSGKLSDTVNTKEVKLRIGGEAKLIAYIGHDGLMDFQINDNFDNSDNRKRDIIILACYSKNYFSPHLYSSNVNPLVWTTGLMCPEAYTLHDAFSAYLNEGPGEG